MKEVVIINGARTPIGHFGKTLKDVPAVNLGAVAIKEALSRSKISKDLIEDVIMGAIHQEGMGNNPARIASLKADIPYSSGALTVNNVCSSGMKAVEIAYREIAMGEKDFVVAGGMESNSQCPYMLMDARWGYRLGSSKVVDALYYDGFTDTYGQYGSYKHVGETAENILEDKKYLSKKYHIPIIELTFNEVNQFALNSHEKYFKANEKEFFDEITPINMKLEDNTVFLDKDESPRDNLSLSLLNSFQPIFRKDGWVTKGNTPPLNDGAAAIILTSKKKASELGIQPLGKIISFASGNVEPEYMGIGPILAIRKLFNKTKIKKSSIDFFEINEAQAQQALFCIKALKIELNKVNVNGGAIAIGHPPGMTGTRLILTSLYNLKKANKNYAICSQCAGGGTGMALLLQSIKK